VRRTWSRARKRWLEERKRALDSGGPLVLMRARADWRGATVLDGGEHRALDRAKRFGEPAMPRRSGNYGKRGVREAELAALEAS